MQYKFAQDFKPHHVVKPFQIPSNWKIIKSFAHGYNVPFIVAWFAVSDEGKVYLINHVTGTQKSVKEIADIIKSTQDNNFISCNYNIADNAIFFKDGETSIYKALSNNGIEFKPANSALGSRSTGWNKLHELLQNNKFFIFAGNSVFTGELFAAEVDRNDPDDVDSRYTRHLDVIRYALQVVDEVTISRLTPTDAKKIQNVLLQLKTENKSLNGRNEYLEDAVQAILDRESLLIDEVKRLETILAKHYLLRK